jgi:glycosyltransferase involved in cell wall biosynthesis
MKIAFVVQRYGLEINGGAELHCRWVAEHMKKHFETEVLTTKTSDYITWKDRYSKDEDVINGIRVRRFPVTRARNPGRFGRIQDYLLHHYYFFFSYRYYHSYWGINAVPHKSILVPTAEHDPVIHLQIFKELFRKPRAFIYNSVSHNENILGDVLKGQCLRSNGGLFYENYSEFREALTLLLRSARLRQILGENGRKYFNANYTWEIIENKYLAVLDQLEKEKNA